MSGDPATGPTEDLVVLIVDDEAAARHLAGRILERRGYLCVYAEGVSEARAVLQSVDVALVLCDIGMPGESGLDLVAAIHQFHPTSAVVMLTGQDDPNQAQTALERGASGYLVKPFGANELTINVINALHRRRLERDNEAYRVGLEQQVQSRTRALQTALDEVAHSRLEVIRRLSRAIEMRDSDTGAHIERIGELSALIATRLNLPPKRIELLRLAAPMHDVGKIGIPDAILTKPGGLTAEERADMQRHAEIGYELLSGSGIPVLDLAAAITRTHHERMDGSGYPHGLVGEEIPIEGRIVATADVFDALTNDRVYRPAMSVENALDIITSGTDGPHDPGVVACLCDELGVTHALSRPLSMRATE